jgi:hypothetical protein
MWGSDRPDERTIGAALSSSSGAARPWRREHAPGPFDGVTEAASSPISLPRSPVSGNINKKTARRRFLCRGRYQRKGCQTMNIWVI